MLRRNHAGPRTTCEPAGTGVTVTVGPNSSLAKGRDLPIVDSRMDFLFPPQPIVFISDHTRQRLTGNAGRPFIARQRYLRLRPLLLLEPFAGDQVIGPQRTLVHLRRNVFLVHYESN